jgi:photosystem II stability/assembly factor-like uncharacterized protein
MQRSLANPDPSALDGLRWRPLGPFRGGRVIAVAGHPSDPATFYMGSTGGGVWKTEDGGTYWENISDGFFKRASVGALAVSEIDPNVIYVGMGESTIRSDVSHGDGAYKSTDGGRTWQQLGLAETRNISKVRIHPADPDTVYVAALGHAHGANPERGIYRSTDGGASWDLVLHRSDKAGAVDLSLDATNPRIMYAAFWEGVHLDHTLVGAGPDSGLFRSTDGGDTWDEITRQPGMPRGMLGRSGITASPAKPGRVWAIIEAEDGGGVFRSDDYGETWANVHENKEIRQRPWYYMHIFAHPVEPNTVWVLNLDCWRSTDGGKTFEKVPGTHGDYHDLWIDPLEPSRIIQGNDGGATVSYNGGESWSTTYNQPTTEFYHVTTDNRFPYRIYGAQQDNTTISLPSRSHMPAIAWTEAREIGGGESGYIAVRPDDPDIVFAGNHGGTIDRFDFHTGQRQNIMAWPEEIAGWASRDLKFRFQWTFPIVISPHDPNVLYITSQHVHRSTDEGRSWEVISPDLTRNDPERMGPSGGPITYDNNSMNTYCTIFAFCESPVEAGVFWVGSDDGLVHLLRNGGETWDNVTPPDLPEWSRVSVIEPSPHDAGTAYLAVDRHRLDDFAPYLYRTTDFGQTWTKIVDGIPGDDFVRVVREDPNRPGLLYAGAETGVYVSFDAGEHWQRLQLNMPVVPVHDLVVKDHDLVAGTHGRGFWVLDDLTPLYQMTSDTLMEDVHLFEPRTAVRFWMLERGTGALETGKRYPHMLGMTFRAEAGADGETRLKWLDAGENPPNGVIVYYFLKDPSGPVTLTFLDEDGNEIKTFSSEKPDENANAGQKEEPLVPAKPGLNRFVWNTRFPDAYSFEGAIYRKAEGITGPKAPPGTYQVRIQTDAGTATRSFEIVKDPRVSATQADLDAQFSLLLKIRDKLSDANRAVVQLQDLREQIRYWTKRAEARDGAGGALDSARDLEGKLTAIEEALIQTRWKSSRDAITAPTHLNAKLATLASHVGGGGDFRPPQQHHEVFEELAAKIDEQLERLSTLVEQEVPRFNHIAHETGVPVLIVEGSS